MSMNTRIQAFKSSDEHDKHVRVLEFCRVEGVTVPIETAAYFGDDTEGTDPNEYYDIEIEEMLKVDLGACLTRDNSVEMENRWEIDVSKIPPGVAIIRFTNSY